jgi:hypothetical protein
MSLRLLPHGAVIIATLFPIAGACADEVGDRIERAQRLCDKATRPVVLKDSADPCPTVEEVAGLAPSSIADRSGSHLARIDAPSPRAWQLPIGATLTGVGLASFTTGAVLGGFALARAHEARIECPPGLMCPPSGLELRAQEKEFADASIVLVAVGSLAAATGLALVITAPHEPYAVGVSVGPTALGFAARY